MNSSIFLTLTLSVLLIISAAVLATRPTAIACVDLRPSVQRALLREAAGGPSAQHLVDELVAVCGAVSPSAPPPQQR